MKCFTKAINNHFTDSQTVDQKDKLSWLVLQLADGRAENKTKAPGPQMNVLPSKPKDEQDPALPQTIATVHSAKEDIPKHSTGWTQWTNGPFFASEIDNISSGVFLMLFSVRVVKSTGVVFVMSVQLQQHTSVELLILSVLSKSS